MEGLMWHDITRQGGARQGKAWRGTAWRGKEAVLAVQHKNRPSIKTERNKMSEILLTICMCVPGIQFFVAKAPNSSYLDFLKDEIVSNWLSTSGAGDYNNDGICNP